jgi:segregation and condensation protein B
MDEHRETGLVESVLLLENGPVDVATLSRITDLPVRTVKQAIAGLREEYQRDIHGIEVIELGGGYVLAPKQTLWEPLKRRYGRRNEKKLSRAALETLAIIAYSQPVTRAEIETVRGVSADAMIRLLMDRSLIKEVGKKEAPGKPTQYGTSKEFLIQFRLKSISDLPKLDDVDSERFGTYEKWMA